MAGASDRPAEAGTEHTRILRVMLAVDDCVAYWRAPIVDGSLAERTRAAFDGHWFGTKSEARVKTLMGDMGLRFDAYPVALEALRVWKPPARVAPWICHFHTQLADPIYRRFTGELLPLRLVQGYSTVDREVVARWAQENWPDRWAPATCMKFGGNLLSTAFEAGLLSDRKDPRRLAAPRVPQEAFEYLLYLLREVQFAGGLLDSPYVRSVAPSPETLSDAFRGATAVRLSSLGDVRSLEWEYPSLRTWAAARGAPS